MSKPEELQICLPTIFSQNYNPFTTEEKDYWNIVPSKNKYQSLDLQLMNKSKNICQKYKNNIQNFNNSFFCKPNRSKYN